MYKVIFSLALLSFFSHAYELPSESFVKRFEKKSACNKREDIWNQYILPSQYLEEWPELKTFGAKDIAIMAITGFAKKVSPQEVSDFSPNNWRKRIHAHGAVAKIRFESSDNHPFTGVFQGHECALARLSLTFHPQKDNRGFAQGAAFKFFIDGRKSVNFSSLVSLKDQGQNYNFFNGIMTNIVEKRVKEDFGFRAVHELFKTKGKTDFPEAISVDSLSRFEQNGEFVLSPVSPVQVLMTSPLKNQFQKSPARDFREDLLSLKEGDILYNLYVSRKDTFPDFKNYKDEDKKELLKDAIYVGRFILESEFTVSEFGDSGLFFPHQKVD